MTLAHLRQKCKAALAKAPRDLLMLLVLVLACLASFGLGFLAGRDAGQGNLPAVEPGAAAVSTAADGEVVASKNGAKYYLPWCGGASRIAPGNLVAFASPQDAQAHGYAPAADCAGL